VRLEHHLLGGDLRVRVRDAGQPHRVALGHAVGEREAEDGDRGEVDEAARAAPLGGFERVAGPVAGSAARSTPATSWPSPRYRSASAGPMNPDAPVM
jgi:hypothetical protein